jgi:hypothetical protein
MLARFVLTMCVAATGVLAPAASASEVVGRNASNVRLEVNPQGRALVSYRSGGAAKHVLAWGAVNGNPPSRAPQVHFRVTYSGPRSVRNVCRPYSGPPLAWGVTACTAPDGSYWALQSWQRRLPNYGLDPSPDQAAWELRLSHWTGAPATLDIHLDWSYRRFNHLYGSLTYQGQPVYGFASTSRGSPLDDYGRNIYFDTLNSAYGAGWKRENSALTHQPSGAFCYGFYPHAGRPAGTGQTYRATVIGPGVSPDVTWEAAAQGPYNPLLDATANAAQRLLLAGDRRCKIN